MSLNTHLLLVDPQNDFCDIAQAALPVPGADADLKRAGQLIARCGGAFSRIRVTVDSHNALDIAHPGWWVDAARQGSLDYVRALAQRNKHQLIIWPEHCLIGTPGHNVQANLMNELNQWGRPGAVPVRGQYGTRPGRLAGAGHRAKNCVADRLHQQHQWIRKYQRRFHRRHDPTGDENGY